MYNVYNVYNIKEKYTNSISVPKVTTYHELRLYSLYIILVEIGYSSKGIHNTVARAEISTQISKIFYIVYHS